MRLKLAQQIGLGGLLIGNIEFRRDQAQQIEILDVGRHDLGGDHTLILDLAEQIVNQHGLAGANIAGYDNETLFLLQTVTHIGQRTLVTLAAIEKSRIGIELERLAGQFEVGFVHGAGLHVHDERGGDRILEIRCMLGIATQYHNIRVIVRGVFVTQTRRRVTIEVVLQ